MLTCEDCCDKFISQNSQDLAIKGYHTFNFFFVGYGLTMPQPSNQSALSISTSSQFLGMCRFCFLSKL